VVALVPKLQLGNPSLESSSFPYFGKLELPHCIPKLELGNEHYLYLFDGERIYLAGWMTACAVSFKASFPYRIEQGFRHNAACRVTGA
jgi:hypothetical protein